MTLGLEREGGGGAQAISRVGNMSCLQLNLEPCEWLHRRGWLLGHEIPS